jgi:hypothetical protein
MLDNFTFFKLTNVSHLINLIACQRGPEFVIALINAGALLNIKDNNRETALVYGTKNLKFVVKY